MPKRAWAWLGAALSSGATLFQGGCRGDLLRELDMLSSPEALSSLFFVPRSDLFGLLRFLWG